MAPILSGNNVRVDAQWDGQTRGVAQGLHHSYGLLTGDARGGAVDPEIPEPRAENSSEAEEGAGYAR